MARGNDAAAARRDLDSQYGADHQSAEDLIRAHDETLDPLRIAASNKAIDATATDELDVPEPKFGGEVISYAVRGGVLLVVEDVDGDYRKWHEEVKGGHKRSQARAHAQQGARGEGVPEAQPEQTKAKAVPATTPERTGAGQPLPQIPHDAGAPGTTFAGQDPSLTGAAQVAPENVKVTVVKAKLDELGVQVPSDARKKDELWALLPGDAQTELSEAADKADADKKAAEQQ